MKGFWIIFAIIFLKAGFAETKAASSKIDTVYFQHGDRLTGELISLNKGILKLKTNDVGTVSIEWQNVDSLCILNSLRILKHNGGILYGRLYPSGKNKVSIVIDEEGRKSEIELVAIVELIQLKEKLLSRLSGTLSAGFNYTKATEVSQLDFSGNIDYKGEIKVMVAMNSCRNLALILFGNILNDEFVICDKNYKYDNTNLYKFRLMRNTYLWVIFGFHLSTLG